MNPVPNRCFASGSSGTSGFASQGENVGTLPSAVAILYGNLPPLSAWIANQPVPESTEAKQRFATAFTLKSGGIVDQTALIGVLGQYDQAPILSSPVGALSFIGQNSLLVAASRDLNRFWTEVEEGLEADSIL